eukprot:g26144.t1
MLLMSFRPAIAVVALQAQYGTATVWEPNSSQSPIHFRISGLPSNSSGSMECDLLQPEFIWMQPSLWSESIDCQVGIFSDSSCSQLIESASTAYDSKAFLERRVILGTAGVLDVWIPAHRLSEIVIFRSFGPGIEANSALIAIGIVFAVLCMVHASGLECSSDLMYSLVQKESQAQMQMLWPCQCIDSITGSCVTSSGIAPDLLRCNEEPVKQGCSVCHFRKSSVLVWQPPSFAGHRY